MQIVSINVGQPQSVIYDGRRVRTSGDKLPVPEAWLGRENFTGDAQADLRVHGGPDKAACVYSFDHYPFWQEVLGRPLAPGAFSENLTIAGLRESEICLGDIFQAGAARVQVSQPRQPCFKLAGRLGRSDTAELIHANGFTGLYVRVLDEGLVRAGDAFELLDRHPARITIQFTNEVLHRKRTDRASAQAVLAVEAISKALRHDVRRQLERAGANGTNE